MAASDEEPGQEGKAVALLPHNTTVLLSSLRSCPRHSHSPQAPVGLPCSSLTAACLSWPLHSIHLFSHILDHSTLLLPAILRLLALQQACKSTWVLPSLSYLKSVCIQTPVIQYTLALKHTCGATGRPDPCLSGRTHLMPSFYLLTYSR